jgi:hypothetical protein
LYPFPPLPISPPLPPLHDPAGQDAASYEKPLPNKKPAFGFSAVPLPTKIRRMLPGFHEPTAEALGGTADKPITFLAAPTGSPLLAAAGAVVRDDPPNSRRV